MSEASSSAAHRHAAAPEYWREQLPPPPPPDAHHQQFQQKHKVVCLRASVAPRHGNGHAYAHTHGHAHRHGHHDHDAHAQRLHCHSLHKDKLRQYYYLLHAHDDDGRKTATSTAAASVSASAADSSQGSYDTTPATPDSLLASSILCSDDHEDDDVGKCSFGSSVRITPASPAFRAESAVSNVSFRDNLIEEVTTPVPHCVFASHVDGQADAPRTSPEQCTALPKSISRECLPASSPSHLARTCAAAANAAAAPSSASVPETERHNPRRNTRTPKQRRAPAAPGVPVLNGQPPCLNVNGAAVHGPVTSSSYTPLYAGLLPHNAGCEARLEAATMDRRRQNHTAAAAVAPGYATLRSAKSQRDVPAFDVVTVQPRSDLPLAPPASRSSSSSSSCCSAPSSPSPSSSSSSSLSVPSCRSRPFTIEAAMSAFRKRKQPREANSRRVNSALLHANADLFHEAKETKEAEAGSEAKPEEAPRGRVWGALARAVAARKDKAVAAVADKECPILWRLRRLSSLDRGPGEIIVVTQSDTVTTQLAMAADNDGEQDSSADLHDTDISKKKKEPENASRGRNGELAAAADADEDAVAPAAAAVRRLRGDDDVDDVECSKEAEKSASEARVRRRRRERRRGDSDSDGADSNDSEADSEDDGDGDGAKEERVAENEMEFCDPCYCYGKCCLDVVASIFCVSLL